MGRTKGLLRELHAHEAGAARAARDEHRQVGAPVAPWCARALQALERRLADEGNRGGLGEVERLGHETRLHLVDHRVLRHAARVAPLGARVRPPSSPTFRRLTSAPTATTVPAMSIPSVPPPPEQPTLYSA